MEDNATPFGDTPADGQQAPAPAGQQAAQQPPTGRQQVAPAVPADGQ